MPGHENWIATLWLSSKGFAGGLAVMCRCLLFGVSTGDTPL